MTKLCSGVRTQTDRGSALLAKRLLFTELLEHDRSQQIVARDLPHKRVLAEGSFLSETIESGLCVQAGSSKEISDAVAVATVTPCLSITVVIQGEVRFAYDDRDFAIKVNPVRQSRHSTGQALAVNLKRLSTFRRYVRKGQRDLTKVHVKIRPEWFRRDVGAHGAIRQLHALLLDEHLAALYWQPGEEALKVCQQILELRQERDPLLRNLHAESLATRLILDLVVHLASRTVSPLEADKASPIQHLDQITRAIAYLEANLHTDICVTQVARACAMSVSVLQRRFKEKTGTTVFEYVRNRRLEKVREALCKDGLSISEAAFMAGYNHTSNFITAFKRRFGITPGDLDVNDSRLL